MIDAPGPWGTGPYTLVEGHSSIETVMAVQRVRPKAMTVAVILGGLAPLMWSDGTGAEVMQRIAAPMIGGMISAPLLSMLVVPAVFLLLQRFQRRKELQVNATARRPL